MSIGRWPAWFTGATAGVVFALAYFELLINATVGFTLALGLVVLAFAARATRVEVPYCHAAWGFQITFGIGAAASVAMLALGIS
jgi:hypothetical protein